MTPSITEVVAERYRVGTWKGGNDWRNIPLFHVWGLVKGAAGYKFCLGHRRGFG